MTKRDPLHFFEALIWRRESSRFVWNDEWEIIADQFGEIGRQQHYVAVQFRRRYPHVPSWAMPKPEELDELDFLMELA